MSGTSVDGIDAGLVRFDQAGKPELLAFHYQSFPLALRQRIAQISRPNQPILLTDYGSLDSELGAAFAAAALALLDKAAITADQVTAIGSHGQTVYHAPSGPHPFSLQIGDPNVIAQRTGITTIADFRRRDMAAGGQGAPLVPAFHRAVFADTAASVAIVNIGGIANVTLLDDTQTLGFDTGPGNTLMDTWCQRHWSEPYDADGTRAAAGTVHTELLQRLRDDDYFELAPPKSTGKEYFSWDWLSGKLHGLSLAPVDVQATLCRLTAETIAQALRQHASGAKAILLCGGGTHNRLLFDWLQAELACPVSSTEAYGIHPDHVEAMAFAWLARQTVYKLAGNLQSVTGAKQPVILGGVYRATDRYLEHSTHRYCPQPSTFHPKKSI